MINSQLNVVLVFIYLHNSVIISYTLILYNIVYIFKLIYYYLYFLYIKININIENTFS